VIIRNRTDAPAVDWGNGVSYRLLVAADNMGFAIAETVVRAGSTSAMEYRRHLEACYCIEGSGEIANADGTQVSKLIPGVLYALDAHDPHFLTAAQHEDLRLISVFNPPIHGNERHVLQKDGFSAY
jgi:L-ectoine synthase